MGELVSNWCLAPSHLVWLRQGLGRKKIKEHLVITPFVVIMFSIY